MKLTCPSWCPRPRNSSHTPDPWRLPPVSSPWGGSCWGRSWKPLSRRWAQVYYIFILLSFLPHPSSLPPFLIPSFLPPPFFLSFIRSFRPSSVPLFFASFLSSFSPSAFLPPFPIPTHLPFLIRSLILLYPFTPRISLPPPLPRPPSPLRLPSFFSYSNSHLPFLIRPLVLLPASTHFPLPSFLALTLLFFPSSDETLQRAEVRDRLRQRVDVQQFPTGSATEWPHYS